MFYVYYRVEEDGGKVAMSFPFPYVGFYISVWQLPANYHNLVTFTHILRTFCVQMDSMS